MTDDLTTRYDGVLERTADGGVIRFERHLAYDVADVWDAITAPERLADWWLPFDADITVDLRVGGEIVFTDGPMVTRSWSARSCVSNQPPCWSTPIPHPARSCAGNSRPTTPAASCASVTRCPT
ncbi:MAG: SRPBCC domain-containing protein [Acidimicrobiales bacterium]